MSAPTSDDRSSGHEMYAPKRSQEQTRIPPAPQLRVNPPPVSPTHVQTQQEWETSRSFSSVRAWEDEVSRRLYEPNAALHPQLQRRALSVLMWISGIATAVCAAVFIALIASTTKPFWQKPSAKGDVASEVTPSRVSEQLAAKNAMARGDIPEIAAVSGVQQVQADASRLAALSPEFEQSPNSTSPQGTIDKDIRFGMSAPFSGPAKELGQNMKRGFDSAFNVANVKGGINGRQLRLVAVDDGYEPARTAETMKQLYEQDRVFAIVGNVGTPTAAVALPYALERRMLFYGAFTGAGLLRRDPPDRYVFNYRASYAEETEAVVRYLIKVRRLKPEQIAVFAQQDSYGDAGFAGVAKAIRSLGGDSSTILRLNYKRNTVDVDEAIAQLQKSRIPIKAVIMVPTYRAAARFIEKTRDLYPSMIYTSVSFVGSTALASELMLLGQKYATGVIVTQVVPPVDGHSSVVLDYKAALAKYFPGEPADYVSLEGYLAGSILVEALQRNGPQLDTEKLVDTLENIRDFDMGLGTAVSFGRTEHQALHKVWGTELDATGHYQAMDLE
jgi:branched-chain amino acid transport system substrate-binding protein